MDQTHPKVSFVLGDDQSLQLLREEGFPQEVQTPPQPAKSEEKGM
jgi:hypothetical protein